MEFKEKILEQRPTFEADENGFVDFGKVSRQLLGKQTQYGSRYIDGAFGEYPKLGEGLRVKGNSDNYHNIKIHKDDIDEFVKRYREYQEQKN